MKTRDLNPPGSGLLKGKENRPGAPTPDSGDGWRRRTGLNCRPQPRGAANSAVVTLSAIFGFALARRVRKDNPARGIRKFPEKKIDRFLSPAELARLGEALGRASACHDWLRALSGGAGMREEGELRLASRRRAQLAVASTAFLFASPAVAQSDAANYVPNYSYIGSFKNTYGTAEVYLDLNQPRDVSNGVLRTAVKVMIPNQNYYHHLVDSADISPLSAATKDMVASYFTVLIGVDCASKETRAGHAVFYNAEDEWIADHNYGWTPSPITPNSLGFVVMQKTCGG
ncbi:MAG: hypothetical protein ACREEB_18245 [Caulobacteraceae bacterium]